MARLELEVGKWYLEQGRIAIASCSFPFQLEMGVNTSPLTYVLLAHLRKSK